AVCATVNDPDSGTMIRSTPVSASARLSPASSTPMRMPVCAQPGVASSTTLSQPSRPIVPRRWNQFPSSVMAPPARIRSAVLGEAEVDAAVEGGVEPPAGDRLLAGEEVEAMDTVRLRIAEQR